MLLDELVGELVGLARWRPPPSSPSPCVTVGCSHRALAAAQQTGCLATGRRWRGRGVPMLTVTLRLCTRRHGRR